MKHITRLYGLFTAVSAIVAITSFLPEATAQTPYGTLVYQDDFSVSNSVWQSQILGTQDNSTAIAASYVTIGGGLLQLKANVGCGWNYVDSIASLQVPLPNDYVIQYQFSKTEWCGPFAIEIAATNKLTEDAYISDESSLFLAPQYSFNVAGSWFANLGVTYSTNSSSIAPVNGAFSYDGTWYSVKIVKHGGSVVVFVNGNQQYNYAGPLLSGGFLHFIAMGAGSTVAVKNLQIYDTGTLLSISPAAFNLNWLANSNANYQVQWSTNLQTWNALTNIIGAGHYTNVVDWVSGPKRFYRLTVQ
jgi:hypothetical protein